MAKGKKCRLFVCLWSSEDDCNSSSCETVVTNKFKPFDSLCRNRFLVYFVAIYCGIRFQLLLINDIFKYWVRLYILGSQFYSNKIIIKKMILFWLSFNVQHFKSLCQMFIIAKSLRNCFYFIFFFNFFQVFFSVLSQAKGKYFFLLWFFLFHNVHIKCLSTTHNIS